MPNTPPNLQAGGNIYPSRFVKGDTADDFNILQADANAQIIGISQVGTEQPPLSDMSPSAYAAGDGDPIQIFSLGDVCHLVAGDSIAAFDRLKADANGKGVPIATTGTTIQNVGAIALHAAAADELVLVMCHIDSIRPALT